MELRCGCHFVTARVQALLGLPWVLKRFLPCLPGASPRMGTVRARSHLKLKSVGLSTNAENIFGTPGAPKDAISDWTPLSDPDIDDIRPAKASPLPQKCFAPESRQNCSFQNSSLPESSVGKSKRGQVEVSLTMCCWLQAANPSTKAPHPECCGSCLHDTQSFAICGCFCGSVDSTLVHAKVTNVVIQNTKRQRDL